MNKIDAWRVRILLKGATGKKMAVTASPLGGWFKVRPAFGSAQATRQRGD